MVVIDNLQIMDLSKTLTSKANAMQLLENFLPFISRSTQQANESISRGEDKIAQSLLPQDLKNGYLSLQLATGTVCSILHQF